MAIAEMRKLHLVAMSYDKDAILNALQKTGAAEIKLQLQRQGTEAVAVNAEELSTRLTAVEAALATLTTEVENYEKAHKVRVSPPQEGFLVSYSEFMSAKDSRAHIEEVVSLIARLTDRKNALKAELAKAKRETNAAQVYALLATPFSSYQDTECAQVRLGALSMPALDACVAAMDAEPLCAYQVLNGQGGNAVLCVAAHKSVAAEVGGILSAYGFTDCPYKGEQTGAQLAASCIAREAEIATEIERQEEALYALKDELRPLKIYSDYLSFEVEKELSGEKLLKTETTFLLEAYVPLEEVEEVGAAIQEIGDALYYEFTEPTDEDTPPTLLHNTPLVENFEGITNTYSPPNYREFDPNTIMMFFYSIFMGFIMADIGYGLLMTVVGGYLWLKNIKYPTGMSRLAGAFAFGGIFTIVWGALFNSFFGFPVLPFTVMPNAQEGKWLLAGIEVPSILVVAMLLGVCQLCAGYLCKAAQEFRRKNLVDGIFDGVLWAFFSIGLGLAIVGFVEEANLPMLQIIGAGTAGGSLALAALSGFFRAKGIGRITKPFGTVYGIINYASDILSYARLYGLMLSGAVIAGLLATYGGPWIVSGDPLMMILGVVLIVVGNLFNLVISLLGAYIHNARLQYVEFYGKFFEGEGELFRPLGGEHKYVRIARESGGGK